MRIDGGELLERFFPKLHSKNDKKANKHSSMIQLILLNLQSSNSKILPYACPYL